jgi:hypothetical protein
MPPRIAQEKKCYPVEVGDFSPALRSPLLSFVYSLVDCEASQGDSHKDLLLYMAAHRDSHKALLIRIVLSTGSIEADKQVSFFRNCFFFNCSPHPTSN